MNKYISDFQIFGTSIKHLKIKNDFILLDFSKSMKKKLDITHSVVSVKTLDDNNTLMGIIHLNIKTTLSDEGKKYTIDMKIEGCFIAPKEFGEESFKEMLQINGITSLYSLARAFIHSTTAQTVDGIGVLLPMINVVEYSKSLDTDNNEE